MSEAAVAKRSITTRHVLVAGLLVIAGAAVLLLAASDATAQGPTVQYVMGATSGRIAYSYDGITWTAAANTPAFDHVWATGFNGTHWVAAAGCPTGLGCSGPGTVWISTDGINWQDYPIPFDGTTWGGVTWGDGHWTIAGGDFLVPQQPVVITSTDGINWSPGTIASGIGGIRGATHNGDTWVAGGSRGLAHSADGITWTYVGTGGLATGVDIHVRAQIYCWGTWYAASSLTSDLVSSTDGGATWSLGPNVGTITKFATDGDIVVAVGTSGSRIWTSTDMVTWTPRPNPLTDAAYALTYGDGLFVAATWAFGGQIVTSPDGITWTAQTPPWPSAQILSLSSREGNEPRICQEARADSYTFNEDQAGQAFDVRSNDVTQFGPLTVSATTSPTKGSLSGPNAAGLFTYTPNLDAIGADSFTYTAVNTNGQSSSATVSITINAVNDAPSFVGDASPIMATPGGGERIISGWGTLVRPGPASATDEAAQSLSFVLASNSNSAMFTSPPVVERTGSAGSTVANPLAGDFALLRFTTSGGSGSATVCFRVQDSGGIAAATNTWLITVFGDDLGDATQCVDILENGPPVAYFSVSTGAPAPGEPATFNSCPGAIPQCSHDPDGAVVQYLWEFGDGMSSGHQMPSHVYQNPGSYLVRLTVWDNNGMQASYTATVTVGWRNGGTVDEEAPGNSRAAPVADAGDDRTVTEGTLVYLAGTHKGGDAGTSFQWIQVGGPDVKLMDANAADPSFRAPKLSGMEPVELVFSLRVWDGPVGSAADHVAVRVVSANSPPVANAGGTIEAKQGDTITLDGAGSRDADGDNLTYRWEQVLRPGDVHVGFSAGPAGLATFGSGLSATFVADEAGTYSFILTVSDGKAVSQDTATVVIRPVLAPAAPAPSDEEDREAPLVAPHPSPGLDVMPLLIGAGAFVAVAGLVALVLARRARR